MMLSRRRLGLTVGLLSGALVGLMAVQGLLLHDAWRQKEKALERNVLSALVRAVQQVEVAEIAHRADDLMSRTIGRDAAPPIVHRSNGTPVTGDSLIVMYSRDATWVDRPDSARAMNITLTIEGDRARLIRHVVGELVDLQPPPVALRLAQVNLDSVLTAELRAAGIDLEPRFAVLSADGDSVAAFGPADASLRSSRFRARLFPLDRFGPRFDLVLGFRNEDAFVLRQIAPLLGASLVLLAVVVIGFARTVAALREQQRFARQVVGFVNNMTHEFKTPLSTISLASEAISRGPEPAAMARYNGMIREEIDRLGRQADMILQVARLESGDVELTRAPLDGNELVREICTAFTLQVEARRGRLEWALTGQAAPLTGDRHHLASVLNNLLDNALKYSPQAPDIRVTTAIQGRELELAVADRGLGVARGDRERVFEPYYRCPTGDRHDVKGFGLGLSIVRLLVSAHGGRVALDENPGGGTRVTIRLPLADPEVPA
jgi:two-component system phosphate regulon sensor histidine kinase PhoR